MRNGRYSDVTEIKFYNPCTACTACTVDTHFCRVSDANKVHWYILSRLRGILFQLAVVNAPTWCMSQWCRVQLWCVSLTSISIGWHASSRHLHPFANPQYGTHRIVREMTTGTLSLPCRLSPENTIPKWHYIDLSPKWHYSPLWYWNVLGTGNVRTKLFVGLKSFRV